MSATVSHCAVQRFNADHLGEPRGGAVWGRGDGGEGVL